jgi:hypothetical protein
MHEQLIPTPWDLFCAGHIELPDGNILVAGGTARYENLDPTQAAGSMTVVNNDTAQPWTLPKGTIFTTPNGAQFASAFTLTIPRATQRPGARDGQPTIIPSQQNVWVDAVKKGKGSLMAAAGRYQVQGLIGPQADNLLYGLGTPMTLQKQNFQGTKDAYIFDVKTSRYVKVNSMNYARWYPTLAEMGNGMDMAISGLDDQGQITMNSEMFNPATKTWAQGPARGFPTYPATFLTENGQLFFTGSNSGYGPSTPAWRTPGFWNTATNAFRPVPGIADPQDLETSATAAPGSPPRYGTRQMNAASGRNTMLANNAGLRLTRLRPGGGLCPGGALCPGGLGSARRPQRDQQQGQRRQGERGGIDREGRGG